MKGFKISRLTGHNLPVFRKYIGEVFHQKHILRDVQYFKWQYSGFYVASANDTIVGHFGFKDLEYKIYDTVRTVRALMNLFVLEPYRSFGVSALLARKVLETPHAVFTSGYTEETTKLVAHLRPSWKDRGNFRRFVAIIDGSAPILSRYANKKFIAKLQKSTLLYYPKNNLEIRILSGRGSFGTLWRDIRKKYPVTIERTDAYINWRFARHPMFRYNFLTAQRGNAYRGYLVYKYEKCNGFKIARIVDLIAIDQAAEESLIYGCMVRARHDSANVIDFLFSGTFYRDVLLRLGFFTVSRRSCFADFPIFFSPIEYGRMTYINAAYDFSAPLDNCYFTKADGDSDRPNFR